MRSFSLGATLGVVVGCGRDAAPPPPPPVTVPAVAPVATPTPTPAPAPALPPTPAPVAALPPVPKITKCTMANLEIVMSETCEELCRAGNGEACAVAATKYWGGTGVRANTHKCLELGLRGCDLGSAEGCSMASSVYSGFHDDDDDKLVDHAREHAMEKRAVVLFEKDCTAGVAMACDRLGDWYAHGVYAPLDATRGARDAARAEELRKTGCAAGDGYLCSLIALFAPSDAPDRTPLYRRACELGHAPSCVEAAGKVPDGPDGDALLRRGCELGYGRACATLADHITDDARSLSLDRRACELRDSFSCARLIGTLEAAHDATGAAAVRAQACVFDANLCKM